jgi:hypothetical protein
MPTGNQSEFRLTQIYQIDIERNSHKVYGCFESLLVFFHHHIEVTLYSTVVGVG